MRWREIKTEHPEASDDPRQRWELDPDQYGRDDTLATDGCLLTAAILLVAA